jgi:hypothetical protein
MKTVTCFDDCLAYVNKMGFIPKDKAPGWIPDWQRKACDLCDKFLAMSGQDTWYQMKAFEVEYNKTQRLVVVYYYGIDVIAGHVHIN